MEDIHVTDKSRIWNSDLIETLELYNLKDDPQEKDNLFAKNQKVARELQAALRLHVQRGGATPWEPPAADARNTAARP